MTSQQYWLIQSSIMSAVVVLSTSPSIRWAFITLNAVCLWQGLRREKSSA